ncbi:methionine adenosyltransferase [Halanaerobium sp.]|jgi:S-adenosylmethionine synthetase|uniref:methionine adenosyltransferase n=1 Tax=Halanaerobium sp. TaxID=1895664 RepID=UPI000DE708C4|nr:methionine adenosyltransferase [Halanaerobium sp.]PUU88047.1 MAG: S-adenosylmethionine synthase [Halanaerobium sp.]
MPRKRLVTSESVTEGHPDKVCDQISDAILDAIMEKDPMGRVACETLISTGYVMVTGEITTDAYVDIPSIVRDTIKEIGYDDAKSGMDYSTCAVMTTIDEQSPDIAAGVNEALEIRDKGMEDEVLGAGDQGLMYGYACNETEELMPLPISLAHQLTYNLTKLRKDEVLEYLRPDGKSQVTVEYIDDKPNRIDTVLVSTQHTEDVSQETIKEDLTKKLIKKVIPAEYIDEDTKILINPSGRFVLGGPHADAGLTGRKIIVDTYGGPGRHGGGAFSGKDCTKVDRSGSYAARYVAKNIVAAELADKCEVQISYAIGVANPVSISVDTFGTNKIEEEKIEELIRENFDLRPGKIIDNFDLRRPIYKNTAAYGHFGRRDVEMPWEQVDMINNLKAK